MLALTAGDIHRIDIIFKSEMRAIDGQFQENFALDWEKRKVIDFV